jgi:YVTN family beta-propeller protein
VYVANEANDNVTTLNGSHIVNELAVGKAPSGVAYDPANQWVYVANSGSDSVSVLNGTATVATVTVGSDPTGVGYDPANGYVYVTNFVGNSLTAINGTKAVGWIHVGTEPRAVAADPRNGYLYVANYGSSTVSIVSTMLALSPLNVSPIGDPVASADVGQRVFFNTTLWAVGAGIESAGIPAETDPGMGCNWTLNVTSTALHANLSLECTPTYRGTFAVEIDVLDNGQYTVWARTTFTVYRDPVAVAPVAMRGSKVGIPSADVNQTVSFLEAPLGGSPDNWSYAWTGLPPNSCLGTRTDEPSCFLSSVGALSVWVTIRDGNGLYSWSRGVRLVVNASPAASVPTLSQAGADVGQTIGIAEAPANPGAGVSSFLWSGLPPGNCTGLSTARVRCALTLPAQATIEVTITDANGEASTSPPVYLTVSPLPEGSAPVANRSSADAGQNLSFTGATAGGAGGLTYQWDGLPNDCVGTNSSTPSCRLLDSGVLRVRFVAVDANGGASAPSGWTSFTVYSDPTVSAPSLSDATVPLGALLTGSVRITGGYGNDRVYWRGLPEGCSAAGSELGCRPNQTGVFHVSVAVTDGNGVEVVSSVMALTVAPVVPPATVSWSSPPLLYGVAADVAAVAFAVYRFAFRPRTTALQRASGARRGPPAGSRPTGPSGPS